MRQASVSRKSKETAIEVRVKLDGRGKISVKTGIPFLDHMLTLFATHGVFDLTVKATGDLDIELPQSLIQRQQGLNQNTQGQRAASGRLVVLSSM